MEAKSSYGKLAAKMTVPAASLIAALLGLMLACLLFVASYQSEVAQYEQSRLAAGAIQVQSEHVRRRAMDYGAWDDAVENFVTHPNAEWADENVGMTVFMNLDMEMTVVVSPDGKVTYASVRGLRTSAGLDDLLTGGISELIARQRAGPRNDAVSGLVLANGYPAIAAVMPIRPLVPDPQATYPQHMIILVDLLDKAMLTNFANIYLLPGLHFLTAGEQPRHSVPIVLSDGRTFGALAWRGADPGSSLLWLSIPVWIAVTTCFAAVTAILIRRAASLAARFDDNEHRARHDSLTGLPNRFFLFQSIEHLAAQRPDVRSFAIAYMDLDGFKPINDHYGHAVGDLVLCTIAERVRAILPDLSFIARHGGDEFVAVLHDVDCRQAARRVCEKILGSAREPILIGESSVTLSVTIGVAFFPVDGADALTLLRRADEALYDGKKKGKGTVCFHGADEQTVVERFPVRAIG